MTEAPKVARKALRRRACSVAEGTGQEPKEVLAGLYGLTAIPYVTRRRGRMRLARFAVPKEK